MNVLVVGSVHYDEVVKILSASPRGPNNLDCYETAKEMMPHVAVTPRRYQAVVAGGQEGERAILQLSRQNVAAVRNARYYFLSDPKSVLETVLTLCDVGNIQFVMPSCSPPAARRLRRPVKLALT